MSDAKLVSSGSISSAIMRSKALKPSWTVAFPSAAAAASTANHALWEAADGRSPAEWSCRKTAAASATEHRPRRQHHAHVSNTRRKLFSLGDQPAFTIFSKTVNPSITRASPLLAAIEMASRTRSWQAKSGLIPAFSMWPKILSAECQFSPAETADPATRSNVLSLQN